MKIQELYDRDIARRINPAVVVSEMEDYFIRQEIDEYVFTPGITKNMYKFLEAIANKKEGKTGVWISGYYGSGKSHFIKYLFYCLHEKYRENAFQNFKDSVDEIDPLEEPNIGLITGLKNKLDKLTIAEIIFNIDAVSDNKGEKDRITRVLLNQLNAYRGYNNTNIALALYLEKPLDKIGKLDDFKAKIKSSFKEDWDGNQIRFVRMYLDKVIGIAQEFDPELDKESLKASILQKQDYTIEFLISELKDFLSDKSEDYRLLFLIDEVSQYIGSNTSLLLNLQTIVEEIGTQIGTKVWIVCTAQQDLSNLIDNTDSKTEDFGKILGRFETMISLESQKAELITKKRILEKNSEGVGVLNDYYKENKGAIENQFIFDHDLYENYHTREDFTLTYPFVPYQFRLISDVFESFSNVGYVGEGVKNTERSILGITHYTANLCKSKEIGYFVPFDLFFNEQLEKNITHRARGILDRAYNIEEVKNDAFSHRVVNVLFMISNLGESQSVNFPANVENIALLLMESADTPKQEMQDQVQKVLDKLTEKNIVQVSEGKYRFLKDDEVEVANLIRTTPITNEDQLTYIYNDIIKKVVKPNPVLSSFGNKNFRINIKVDDKEYGTKGDFEVKFSIYDATDIENLAHSTPATDLVIGISEWFRNDNELKKQITEYVKTQKYISQSTASATGTRSETLHNFRKTNEILLKEIITRFSNKFMETAIISKQQVIPSDQLKGNTVETRFYEMLKLHWESVYNKHSLSNGYATSNADLLNQARNTQKLADTGLNNAEEELNNKIKLFGESPVVGDIVKQFEKTPYGWKDISTLDILLRIAQKGLRRFEWNNEEIDFETFANKAINNRERDSITVHKEKVHSKEETEKFISVVNDIFNESIISSDISDFKTAVEAFKLRLQPKLEKINKLKEEYEGYPFAKHIKTYHTSLGNLYQTRDFDKLANKIIEQENELKTLRDHYMYVEEFIENNFSSYKQILEFADTHKNNFSTLDETQVVRAEDLKEYLKSDTEPWDKFPQMRKAFKELNDAIKAKVANLKEKVTNLYEQIFEEISAKKQELGIDAENITGDKEAWLEKIKKETQIARLEIHELRAEDFKAESIKSLEEYKAKEEAKKSGKEYVSSVKVSVAREMPPRTIETAEQLEEYIEELRKRLMLKLAKNKKIFLN